jgi:hypothetical protein
MNKSVLDKLSKFEKNVELAEVKVDLANVKDLQRRLSLIIADQKKLDKINPALDKLIKDQKEAKDLLAMRIKDTEAVMSDFEKTAKDLGLDASSSSEYKTLKTELENSKSVYLK